MKKITIQEVEYISYDLAKNFLARNEPIPDFSTRFSGVLERCVSAHFQTYNKKYLYSGFLLKVSILFYLMIKNHPFQNGNKRIAMTTVFYLLYKNKKWIKVDNTELYNFAKWVTESNPKLKDETVAAIQKFFKSYLVNL